jgi:hypothetical protein
MSVKKISILGANFNFRLFENHITEILNDYAGQFLENIKDFQPYKFVEIGISNH